MEGEAVNVGVIVGVSVGVPVWVAVEGSVGVKIGVVVGYETADRNGKRGAWVFKGVSAGLTAAGNNVWQASKKIPRIQMK